jgi:tetrahydromethanopterin S-methyltransferase subunit G
MLMVVMMSPREKWTDERLDDLSTKVDRGFSEVKSEMREGFTRMEARFEKVDERFEKIDERFHNLHLTLMGAAAVVIATLLGALLM